MESYIEQEIKVLDVNITKVRQKLEALGAKLVFDDYRIFTTFDTPTRQYAKENKIIRLTEEGKLKLSISNILPSGKKETIKVFTSRKEETIAFLKRLGLVPIARVKSHRISYELGNVDFDIDKFPRIPAFMEIDLEYLEMPLTQLLKNLDLDNNKYVTLGTEEIFSLYKYDYYELFRV